MLTTVRNDRVDRWPSLLRVGIALAIACSVLLVAEAARTASVAVLATGAVAWGLVEFLEWRRGVHHRAWPARIQFEAAAPRAVPIDRLNTWRRRALKHLVTWLQAAALVPLLAFAILLLGVPVALMARGAIELVSWIVGSMR